MMRRLRFKFILVSMLSLLAVLTVIMLTLNIVNYQGIIQDADSVLALLQQNAGQLPRMQESFDWRNDGPRYKSPELLFEIRFFSVLFSENGEIEDKDMGQIAALDDATAEEYASRAYASGRERGFVKDYRFIRYADAEGVRMIFLDYGRVLSNHRDVIRNSVMISALGLLAVLALIVILSKRIMKPFAENYEKQKLFISDAGHEIKTPITIIDAAAEVLEMECGENEWLHCIRQQATRLGTLTGDLIRLSRMEEGKTLEMIPFPFSELAEETAEAFALLAKAQNKELRLYIQPDVVGCGNEEDIRKLISVLLDNALKYSPEESIIRMRLVKRSKGIALEVENECLHPLAQEQLERMFDRFWRGDPSRNSRVQGYGIGLSIARAIVIAHRGKINAELFHENSIVISAFFPN